MWTTRSPTTACGGPKKAGPRGSSSMHEPGGRSSCPCEPRADRFRPRSSMSPTPGRARSEAIRLRTRLARLTSASWGRRSITCSMCRTGATRPSVSSISGSCTAERRNFSKGCCLLSRGRAATRQRGVPPMPGWPRFLETRPPVPRRRRPRCPAASRRSHGGPRSGPACRGRCFPGFDGHSARRPRTGGVHSHRGSRSTSPLWSDSSAGRSEPEGEATRVDEGPVVPDQKEGGDDEHRDQAGVEIRHGRRKCECTLKASGGGGKRLAPPDHPLGLGDGVSRWRRALQIVKEILWGLFFFDLYTENMKMRIRYNDAVNLLVFSEQLGIPLMNSYVSMRLLPYFVGELEGWKRREMREREILEEAPEIH